MSLLSLFLVLLTFRIAMEARQQNHPDPPVQLLWSKDIFQVGCEGLLEGVVKVELIGASLSIAEDHQHS